MTFGLLAVLVAYSVLIEPYRIEITQLKIKTPHLNKILKGKTAVHLTDLHIGEFGRREKKVLEIIDSIEPDLIFLTGDYVQWKGDYEIAITFLSKLRAPMGVWGVMGDYDYSNSRKSCLFCHEPNSKNPATVHQVHFLNHSRERLKFPGGEVWIGGVDDSAVHALNADKVLNLGSAPIPAIILSHNPFAFDEVGGDHETLILSGDTHGGQIALPLWFWKILGYGKMVRFNQGWFKQGEKKMYVSRGVGTSHIPVRILKRPEIAVLHF